MARANSSQPASEARPSPAGSTTKSPSVQGIAVWILLAVLVVAALPTFMVLAVGLAPTLAAFFLERGKDKSSSRCIATMNLAGVAPVVAMLWARGHTVDAALGLLGDVYNWLFMYGAAAIAVGLLSLMRGVAAAALQAFARQRLRSLRSRQKKLIGEWGDEVDADRESGVS